MGRAFEYRRAAKEKRWGMMSRVFPRLGKAITLAAKEGGGDPETNARLRTAIQNAKAQNMPKDNIENAIKRATHKDMDNFTEVFYEGKGPHGLLVYIECATDNSTRTIANLKSYFTKVGGAIVPNGQLEFMFDRKAVFEIEKSDKIDLENLEFELIDAGLEEIDADDETIVIYGDYTAFGTLQTALDDIEGVEITKSSLQRFPTTPIEISEEQMVDVDKLMEKVEEDDDVQQVFTNMG